MNFFEVTSETYESNIYTLFLIHNYCLTQSFILNETELVLSPPFFYLQFIRKLDLYGIYDNVLV